MAMTLKTNFSDAEWECLVKIAKCKCGKVGLGRNGTQGSGTHRLRKAKCSGCGTSYNENIVRELIVREPPPVTANPQETTAPPTQLPDAKQPRWTEGQRVNTEGLLCPICGAEELNGAGKPKNIQQYKCKKCGRRTTQPKRKEVGINENTRSQGSS